MNGVEMGFSVLGSTNVMFAESEVDIRGISQHAGRNVRKGIR